MNGPSTQSEESQVLLEEDSLFTFVECFSENKFCSTQPLILVSFTEKDSCYKLFVCSSVLCPTGGKIMGQYAVMNNLLVHYKKLEKAKRKLI